MFPQSPAPRLTFLGPTCKVLGCKWLRGTLHVQMRLAPSSHRVFLQEQRLVSFAGRSRVCTSASSPQSSVFIPINSSWTRNCHSSCPPYEARVCPDRQPEHKSCGLALTQTSSSFGPSKMPLYCRRERIAVLFRRMHPARERQFSIAGLIVNRLRCSHHSLRMMSPAADRQLLVKIPKLPHSGLSTGRVESSRGGHDGHRRSISKHVLLAPCMR